MRIFKGWDRLSLSIDTDAFHNSAKRKEAIGDLPRLYDNVFWKTIDWTTDSQATEGILWVHGPLHTSAIAQVVAGLHEQDHAALATYFVSKYPDNDDVRARFISTIAYQLGLSFPRTREEISNIIAHNPAILSRSTSCQLNSLILKPLAQSLTVPGSVVDGRYNSALIIVDGCDYLDNDTQQCIVNALCRIVQQFPLRVRILLFTKSSFMLTTSLALGIENGSVTEIVFEGEHSFGVIAEQIWTRIKNKVWTYMTHTLS